jgi:ATP-binding cassette, subfamily B, multidrug efflux pump
MTRAPTPAAMPRGPGAAGMMAAQMAGGAKAKDSGAALRRLATFLMQSRWRVAAAVTMTVASVALSAVGPWQLGRATDSVLADVTAGQALQLGLLARQLGLVAAMFLAAALFNWRQAWLVNDLVQDLSRSLRDMAEAKLSRLPLAWFDGQPYGEVLSRVTNDIDNITQSLQQLLSQFLMSLLTLVAVLGVMVLISPPLAGVAVVMLVMTVLLTRVIAKKAGPEFTAQWRQTGEMNGEVEESFTGNVLVKVYGHRAATITSFAKVNDGLQRSAFRAQMLGGLIQPLAMAVGNLALIAVVVGGAFRVLSGALTVGELQAFIQYIRQITHPMQQVAAMATTVQSGLASSERVFQMLDLPELAPDRADAPQIKAPLGLVVFDHVGFAYKPDAPLFRDVSLTALPGQTVAIVGPTGAGKTTLVNLLMRFYEVTSGRILLDGVDTAQMAREDLRRHFGMVLQDTWLFTGTVRDNIAYGRPDATEAEIREAAQVCHLDSFVRALPQGYDTVINPDDGLLSAGQRQLLTIARAFLMRPVVLILDEATSSVDTRTELLVQHAMAKLREGRTSFVIAHRLSTIRSADLIIYMEAGTVMEQGTHDALIAARGRYWQLYRAQFDEGDPVARSGGAVAAQ